MCGLKKHKEAYQCRHPTNKAMSNEHPVVSAIKKLRCQMLVGNGFLITWMGTLHDCRSSLSSPPSSPSPPDTFATVATTTKEIEKAFRKISRKGNILLVTSVTLNNQTAIFELVQTMLLNIYNKNIEINKNKTNDRLTVRVYEKVQHINSVNIRKQYALSMEELLTTTESY